MALSPLQSFLIEAAHEPKTQKIHLHGRLKTQEFTIKGLTLSELDEARKRAVNPSAKGEDRVSSVEVTAQTIVAGCISPNFKDAEFIAQLGVTTPSECVQKALLAGEANELCALILRASGVVKSNEVEEAREEARD